MPFYVGRLSALSVFVLPLFLYAKHKSAGIYLLDTDYFFAKIKRRLSKQKKKKILSIRENVPTCRRNSRLVADDDDASSFKR